MSPSLTIRPLLALLALATAPLLTRAADTRAPFIVNYDATVDGREVGLHRTAILSPEAAVEEASAAEGVRILGYISLGELSAADAATPEGRAIPTLGVNAAWGSALPDVTSPAWAAWILDRCAPRVAARGWSGFFLDTLDSARLPAGLPESVYVARERAMADLLRRLRAKYPRMTIVANRGFASLALAPEAFDGVLAEGVLSTHTAPGRYARVPEPESRALRAELDRWKAAGKRVLALDYCDPSDRREARSLYERLSAFGYEAAVATPDLMRGSSLAPLRKEPDRALVVYGRDIGPGLVQHPTESETNGTLKHPVEWRGYSLEYVNIRESGFPDLTPYDLVILENFEPLDREAFRAFARRVADRLKSGRKTVFLSELSPWRSDAECWEAITLAAGWGGSGGYSQTGLAPVPVMLDPLVARGEAGAKPAPDEPLPDLSAPPDATPLVRMNIIGEGETLRSDPVFAARFGGVLLEPWLNEADAIGREKSRVDLFAFADRALGAPVPVFDTATRFGNRMFFAHVDGDGLQARSKVDLSLVSGEVMRDEIFKAYGMPFSVSVITGEIRGMTAPRADADEVRRRHEVARSIFALPNVEIASHTHSHPFAWTQDSSTAKNYRAPRLSMLPEFDRPVDMLEETVGSVDYIERHLAPPGKRCRLMLWSGNCMPPPEAIAALDARGIPNLNGLTGAPTFEYPFLSAIRGGAMRYRGVTQVGAPFENDNVYYDMEEDGLEGGFDRVIEAFEITAAPRRLLPVDAYWHFFSADTQERLRSLKRVLDWAAARPLHPVFASEYAAMMRDLPKGARYDDARGGRLFLMPPGCLTLRYPGTVYIDMAKSSGVLGYRHELGVTYVHTDGAPSVRLFTRDDDDRLPRLVHSTRPVSVVRADGEWTATFSGFSQGVARFAGLKPRAEVRAAGATLRVGDDGELELPARPGETVKLPVR